MTSTSPNTQTTTTHPEFKQGFIWAALGLALFAGFSIGAHMVSVFGFGLQLGPGFVSFIQIHGHVQLMAWAGLFIMGVSLHFIPRLAGVPLTRPHWPRQILRLMTTGLILRCVGHSVLPYLSPGLLFNLLNGVVAATGLLEMIAVLMYLTLVVETAFAADHARSRPVLRQMRPYFGMMMTGWALYAAFNLFLLFHMALTGSVAVEQALNQFAINLFVGLVLLPVALAFSIRMLPLYLRLPAAYWSVRGLAAAYLLAFCAQVVPQIPTLLDLTLDWPLGDMISNAGRAAKAAVILFFIWKLDVLTRRQDPWTVHRELHPGPERRPTREGLPDYGEFGRFERLVYAAYIWLLIAALLELLLGVAGLTGRTLSINLDAVRHAYVMGFITHLILGISVRMIPGFLGKRRIARPGLVDATFWMATLAALGRVFTLLVPGALINRIPGGRMAFTTLFGLSGMFALVAVACLWINLRKTEQDK